MRERLLARTFAGDIGSVAGQVQMASFADGELVVFPDGLGIALDQRWSEQRMELDPAERGGA